MCTEVFTIVPGNESGTRRFPKPQQGIGSRKAQAVVAEAEFYAIAGSADYGVYRKDPGASVGDRLGEVPHDEDYAALIAFCTEQNGGKPPKLIYIK